MAMKDSTKLIIAGGVGLAAGYLLFKPKSTGITGRASGKAFMALPSSMQENTLGSLTTNVGTVYVTNTSKLGGANTAHTFHFNIILMVGGVSFFDMKGKIGNVNGVANTGDVAINVPAGASAEVHTFTFDIPKGIYGAVTAYATLYDTDDATIIDGPKSTTGTIVASVVIPAGTIAW